MLAYLDFYFDVSEIHVAEPILDLCPEYEVAEAVDSIEVMPCVGPDPTFMSSHSTSNSDESDSRKCSVNHLLAVSA